MRLDSLLKNYYRTSSRTYFQGLIEEKFVLVNGEPAKKSYKPEVDDEIEVQFVVTKDLQALPEDIPLDILYEDEHMLAVNKPADLVVHPGHGNWTGTFVNALLFYCKTLERQDDICGDVRPGIVHRLDKDTSGVLIAAKTREMHQKLALLFSSRTIKKRYLALCLGKPKEMTINEPIGRHPIFRKEMAVLAVGGKHAVTHIQVLQSNGDLSLIEVDLETGRTHQIRIHMKHIGHPLLGDPVYGREGQNERYKATRQMLHAESISFIHPITNIALEIKAPMPEDMRRLCERL
jgi:23S rRNA pseudouridine1911/1915/1917 synthase